MFYGFMRIHPSKRNVLYKTFSSHLPLWRQTLMRHLFTLLTFLLIFQACNKEESRTPAPVIRQVPRVQQNESLSTPEKIQTWKDDVRSAIRERPEPMVPSTAMAPLSAFTFDTGSLGTLIGQDIYGASLENPFLQSFGSKDRCAGEKRRLDMDVGKNLTEAQDLEKRGEEWKASRIYQNLGRREDAKRCMSALAKENEWMAAGRLAVELGDLETLNTSVDHLQKEDRISKIRELIRYTLELDQTNLAKHITARMGWKLYDLPWDTLTWAIQCGATDLIPDILPEFVEDYTDKESDRASERGDLLLAYITLQAKTNRPKAMEYARKVLAYPRLNVVALLECGESCSFSPVIGTVEFWNMIRTDPALSKIYLDRMDDWFSPLVLRPDGDPPALSDGPLVDEGPNHPSELSWDISYPNHGHLLWNLLRKVAKDGGPVLTGKYLDMLERKNWAEPSPLSALDREVGRRILKSDWNLNAPDLSQANRYQLSRLMGAPDTENKIDWYQTSWHTYMSGLSLVFEDGSELYEYDLRNLYRAGHLPKKDILRLWKEFGIVTATLTGPVQTSVDQEALTLEAREYLLQGRIPEAVSICWSLLHISGKDSCAFNDFNPENQVEAGYLFELVNRGLHLQDGQMALYDVAVHQISERLGATSAWHRKMDQLLRLPVQTQKDNRNLQKSLSAERQGEVTNFPDAEGLLQEMVPDIVVADLEFVARFYAEIGWYEKCEALRNQATEPQIRLLDRVCKASP